MSPAAETLRELLEAANVDGFLMAYAHYRTQHAGEPAVATLTQRVLPQLLREAFKYGRVTPKAVVTLWRMVRDNRLLVVENDILVAVNERIDAALAAVEPATTRPATPLVTFRDVEEPTVRKRVPVKAGSSPLAPDRVVEVKRVAIVSTFSLGVWSASDAFDFRKNVCASQQEREFLLAVRQYFPSLMAYPNMPLRNFIDIEKLEDTVPMRARSFAWSAQADVLLCTADEDPVAGIELDSVHHDTEEAAERDELKNLLFRLAGIPLVRIRADDTKTVRAEDFYDLLMAESDALDTLRPRRLRPRRNHDFLVPAETYSSASLKAA